MFPFTGFCFRIRRGLRIRIFFLCSMGGGDTVDTDGIDYTVDTAMK